MSEMPNRDFNQIPPAPSVPPTPQQPKKKRTGLIITLVTVGCVLLSCLIGVLLAMAIFTIGTSNMPNPMSESFDFDGGYSSSDVPEAMDIETPELTSDLKTTLEYALIESECSGVAVEVTNLTKESTTKPILVDHALITSEATGQATITYEGRTETVTYTSYYYLDDPDASKLTWFIYDFKLSSYALFPPAFQELMAGDYASDGSGFSDATPVLVA